MGIMTRQQGEEYIITSDCKSDDAPRRRAPRRATGTYQVWTGTTWSAVVSDAKRFDSLDKADEYVRANYAQVTGQR